MSMEKAPGRWRERLRTAAEITAIVLALGTLGMWCSIPDTSRLATENPTSTAFIDLRRAEAEDAGKPWKLHWQWQRVGRISRYLRAAVVYAEDGNFYTHDGVDWNAVQHAVETNLDGGRTIGGSTITQQLAKNLYLSPKRSLLRKLREMLIAFSLEDHLTKTRILELYLNVVEWGDGVFGAEAAARHWFGHSAASLSPAEAARLAIALPNPITRAPDVQDAELTRKAVRIIRLFRMQGLIDATQERDALDQVGAPNEKVLPDRSTEAPPPVPAPPIPSDTPPASPETPSAPQETAPADPHTPSDPPSPPPPTSPDAP
jgi:monofunctional biosynthetic peptidoglycan transglycosylase